MFISLLPKILIGVSAQMCVSLARACYESSLGCVEIIFPLDEVVDAELEFESVARRTFRSRVFFAFFFGSRKSEEDALRCHMLNFTICEISELAS